MTLRCVRNSFLPFNADYQRVLTPISSALHSWAGGPSMNCFPSRARRCLASISLLVATASFAQPALNGPMLRQVLQAMPKGGDLHNHLSGSVYAESYLRYAADDGICVDS